MRRLNASVKPRAMETFFKTISNRLQTPLTAALIVMLFACPVARGQSPPPDLRGIYVYTALDAPSSSPEGQSEEAALNLPGVDGMLLVGLWSSVEPSKGQFQWTNLDRWISYAVSHGKKITLVIRAGDGTPSWLFQPAPNGAGATPLTFTISPHDGKTGVCMPETIAAPWDTAYLTQFDSLLGAVSAHLKTTGSYGAITALRLTGINRTSDELRLPAETAESTGLSCVSDSITTWQQAGYRPSLLLQAWDAVTSSFLKSFPDKSFSVAIITNPPQLPFPAIDENGSVITGMVPDQNPPLLQLASQKLPGRLVVQYNFLLPGIPANPFVITDPNATLDLMAIPLSPGQGPIDLGSMSKTSASGNEFFLIKKGLPAIGSVQITSTSGGTLTASVKGH